MSIRGMSGENSSGGKDSDVEEPNLEPITCPYQKAIMLSMRLQGIMMQQMKEEVMKNRRVFKVYIKPRKEFTAEARGTCSDSVDILQELVNQLGEDLAQIRAEFQQLQKRKEKKRKG